MKAAATVCVVLALAAQAQAANDIFNKMAWTRALQDPEDSGPHENKEDYDGLFDYQEDFDVQKQAGNDIPCSVLEKNACLYVEGCAWRRHSCERLEGCTQFNHSPEQCDDNRRCRWHPAKDRCENQDTCGYDFLDPNTCSTATAKTGTDGPSALVKNSMGMPYCFWNQDSAVTGKAHCSMLTKCQLLDDEIEQCNDDPRCRYHWGKTHCINKEICEFQAEDLSSCNAIDGCFWNSLSPITGDAHCDEFTGCDQMTEDPETCNSHPSCYFDIPWKTCRFNEDVYEPDFVGGEGWYLGDHCTHLQKRECKESTKECDWIQNPEPGFCISRPAKERAEKRVLDSLAEMPCGEMYTPRDCSAQRNLGNVCFWNDRCTQGVGYSYCGETRNRGCPKHRTINGEPCLIENIRMVSNDCRSSEPDFDAEGQVCNGDSSGDSSSPEPAFCSYDVGKAACAYCFKPEPFFQHPKHADPLHTNPNGNIDQTGTEFRKHFELEEFAPEPEEFAPEP